MSGNSVVLPQLPVLFYPVCMISPGRLWVPDRRQCSPGVPPRPLETRPSLSGRHCRNGPRWWVLSYTKHWSSCSFFAYHNDYYSHAWGLKEIQSNLSKPNPVGPRRSFGFQRCSVFPVLGF